MAIGSSACPAGPSRAAASITPRWRRATRTTLASVGSARDGAQALRPDADAAVDDISGFDDIAPCGVCGTGLIKPAVTFFGDVVPKDRVEACSAALDDADGLLCIGTSLAVYSAFRFARRARDDGIPICILNRGPTRCDTEDPGFDEGQRWRWRRSRRRLLGCGGGVNSCILSFLTAAATHIILAIALHLPFLSMGFVQCAGRVYCYGARDGRRAAFETSGTRTAAS